MLSSVLNLRYISQNKYLYLDLEIIYPRTHILSNFHIHFLHPSFYHIPRFAFPFPWKTMEQGYAIYVHIKTVYMHIHNFNQNFIVILTTQKSAKIDVIRLILALDFLSVCSIIQDTSINLHWEWTYLLRNKTQSAIVFCSCLWQLQNQKTQNNTRSSHFFKRW